jgi:RNA polymerase sigma factor (sigma-70 family)
METEGLEFRRLLAEVQSGDTEALGKLVEQYESELRIVARHRLGPALRPFLDSMDLVQSVNKSLMLGLRQQRFDLRNKEDLMRLVSTILRRKVSRHWRKHRRQQRASRLGPSPELLLDFVCSISSTELDPATLAAERDQLQSILQQLDGLDLDLIRLRLDGHSTADAARLMGIDADVTRVRLSRLRKRLQSSPLLEDLV